MKRLVLGVVSVMAAISITGCHSSRPVVKPTQPTGLSADQIEKAPSEFRESLSVMSVKNQIPKVQWGSYGADLAVLPCTQGPVDTYRPLYTVNETKKISGKGEGFSEHEAVMNAIFNGCVVAKCDCIVAAQQMVRTFTKDNRLAFEVIVIGYPATMTGVQTIKAAFYEEDASGALKKIDNPENRYVFKKEGVWKAAELIGEHGPSIKRSLSEKGMDLSVETKRNVERSLMSVGGVTMNGMPIVTDASAMRAESNCTTPYNLR